MALSATFTANFSSFYDAVDKAETKLKDFGAGADKVGGRLTALGNSFSGVKIIQDATLMVKAVEDIGGASKLTEKEMQRLGATTNEAVAKMKALGMDVPKNLQEIADKTKGANKETTDWMGTLGKMAATLGIAFGVSAIKDFIGSVFDAAGAVKDLSDQWGVSTKFVQQWSAAAKLSGVEAEQVGKSIQFMTEKLAESSPEYDALLRNIGLSTDALRKMSTEDAYKQIIQKIAAIKDETLQLDVAMGVLGPNAKKIIGGIRDGMYDAADAQKFMSDETIKRLADAGDAWEKFKNNIIIYTGEILATVPKVTGTITQSWSTFFKTLALGATDAIGASRGAAGAFLQMKSGLDDYQGSLKNAGKDINLVTDATNKNAGAMKTTAQIQAELRAKTDALKESEKARTKVQQDAKKEQDEWNKRLQAEYNAVIDLKAVWSGSEITKKALEYVKALETAIPIGNMTITQQENIHKVMEDAIEVYNAAGKEAPQAMYDIWAATVQAAESTETYQEKLDKLFDTMKFRDLGKFDPGSIGGTPVDLQPPPEEDIFSRYRRSTDTLVRSLGHLGMVTGGTFGDITAAAGDVALGMDQAARSAEDFRLGLEGLRSEGGVTVENLSKTAAGAIGMAASFVQATKDVGLFQAGLQGAMIGLAVGGPFAAYTAAAGFVIGAMTSYFQQSADLTGKEVRKLREQAVEAAGGFELLASRMETAGISMENLNAAYEDPAKLKAAIDEINAAFKYQDDAINLLIDTAEKYGFTLAELGPTLQRQQLDEQAQQLYQDFKLLRSGGIELSLITDKMADSVSEYVQNAIKMGVEVPNAMRPMLEDFADAGTLLDENGNAITSLEDAGISFALTMSDGFKVLINEVQKLTDVISRSLPQAIKDIPQPKVVGQVSWEYDKFRPPEGPAQTQKLEGYQGGTGGFKNFGAGTPVMLHGWEAVVPREDAGAFATVAASSSGAPAAAMAPTVIVNAQGAFFDSPDSLQRLATKVSDALTAKYSVMGKLRAAV